MSITPFWTRLLITSCRVSILQSLTVNLPEFEASFDEADAVPSSVSSGFLCSVIFLIILDHSLLLASNLVNYGARLGVLLLLVPQAGKMSASKLIKYFSSHPAAVGFQAFLPPDNITQNPANKRPDQCPSDFHTGTGVAAHVTLDTEHLISHTRSAIWFSQFPFLCNIKG